MIEAHMIISVIGSSTANDPLSALAEAVGRELATSGATVVCGGLGGVMEAVCKGAKAAGGRTIGILPGNDPAEANEHVDIPICTGIGYARNVIVVKTGSAVIAVGGAFGTLSEIGHALADGIPVIGLGTWSISQLGLPSGAIETATGPADAVERALVAAKSRGPYAPSPANESRS
jgi:uncharacterized protein (TIGR00725 family)